MPDCIKVLLAFNHAHIVGGGELSFIDLAAALPRHGIEPLALVPGPGEVQTRLRDLNVETELLPWPKFGGKTPLTLPSTVYRLMQLCRDKRIDLLHANGARCMLYAGLAARLLGRPCIWHVRVLDRDPWLDRLRARLASRIVANSRAVAASITPYSPTPSRVEVIYNGFDLEAIENQTPLDLRKEWDLPDQPIIMTAGRLCPWKRFEAFIEAAALLQQRIPVSVLIVGEAQPEEADYAQKLRTLAQQRGLKPCVFAGWRQDVIRIMKSAHVFALPSRNEPFGRVLIEAWACGLPVVAARGGGPSELIADGQDGLLLEGGRPDGLAEVMARILTEPDLAQRLREQGLQRAKEFTLDRHASRMTAIYRALTHQQDDFPCL